MNVRTSLRFVGFFINFYGIIQTVNLELELIFFLNPVVWKPLEFRDRIETCFQDMATTITNYGTLRPSLTPLY
jgi:hypothetical protein